MNGIIEQLVDEFNKIFQEKWSREKNTYWRLNKKELPNPNEFKEIWVRDILWDDDDTSTPYFYDEGAWRKHRTINPMYCFSRSDISIYDYWCPKISNEQPPLPDRFNKN